MNDSIRCYCQSYNTDFVEAQIFDDIVTLMLVEGQHTAEIELSIEDAERLAEWLAEQVREHQQAESAA